VSKADNMPPSFAVVRKSGNLNFLEAFGPVQACNGTALPLSLPIYNMSLLNSLCVVQNWVTDIHTGPSGFSFNSNATVLYLGEFLQFFFTFF